MPRLTQRGYFVQKQLMLKAEVSFNGRTVYLYRSSFHSRRYLADYRISRRFAITFVKGVDVLCTARPQANGRLTA